MNKGVEEAEEGGVAAGDPPGAGPDREGHDPVMDHVEQRHVRKLFARNKTKLKKRQIIGNDQNE